MPQIKARLFGGLELSGENGEELALTGRKTRALLGFLIVEADRWHSRDRLMNLFWGDRAETQARNSLNQALYEIRRLETSADVPVIEREIDRIRLNGDSIDCDLLQFEVRLDTDPVSAAEQREGELLEGLDSAGPDFADWVDGQRARIVNAWSTALRKIADSELESTATDMGVSAARRLIGFDPLDESARRSLMLLLARTGHRAEAIRQYQDCASILQDELGIEPEATTRQVMEQIQQSEPLSAKPATQMYAQSGEPLPLPDKPSIAVLPFDNLSDNREFEYLADGLTEDITMLLARIPGFLVIARNSSFAYKHKKRDYRDVATELGVRYVVEGSVRPLGSRMRITVQLIDAANGTHIWANRFDRLVDEIHDVQDEAITGIMAQLVPELTRAEFETVRRRAPIDMDAWAYFQKANGILSLKGWRRETFGEAADLLRRAIDLDPELAVAHAYLALVQALGRRSGLLSEDKDNEKGVAASAETAVELDNQSSVVLGYAGCALCDIGQTLRGIDMLERAVDIDPSNAQSWVALGVALMRQGKVRRGVEMLEHGMRISPLDNRAAYWGTNLANALFRLGRVNDAIEAATLACRRDENLDMARVVLAMILSDLGRAREAKDAIAEAFRINQDLQVDQIRVIIGRHGVKTLQEAGLLSH